MNTYTAHCNLCDDTLPVGQRIVTIHIQDMEHHSMRRHDLMVTDGQAGSVLARYTIRTDEPSRMYTAHCKTCHATLTTSPHFADIEQAEIADHAIEAHNFDPTGLLQLGDVLRHVTVTEVA